MISLCEFYPFNNDEEWIMDLNTILIILGIIALIILVVHGLWANRREKSQYFKSANTFTRDSRLREPPAHIQSASEEKRMRTPVRLPLRFLRHNVPLLLKQKNNSPMNNKPLNKRLKISKLLCLKKSNLIKLKLNPIPHQPLPR